MGQKLINIRVEVDRQLDVDFSEWSEAEGRSKRRHAAVLLRKLVAIRRSRPEELRKLGLLDQAVMN